MDDLFTESVRKPIKLYRGSDTSDPIPIGNESLWFTLSEAGARVYGSHVHQYHTVGNLRLLDITHPTFHQDFMCRVNNHIRDPVQKANALVPLGLPSFEVQMKQFGPSIDGTYDDYSHRDRREKIEHDVAFFGGRHRYSLIRDGIMYDMYMVNAMKRFYPGHDGYVCRVPWPSFHHGGSLIPECCVFNPERHVKVVSSSRVLKAGGRTMDPDLVWVKGKMLQYAPPPKRPPRLVKKQEPGELPLVFVRGKMI